MGITMCLQQKLNPAAARSGAGAGLHCLPIMFTFMLAPLPGRPGDLLGVEQLAARSLQQ